MYEDSIARGSALLDKHRPDWWRKINCERLDVSRYDDDILGQLYGGFETGFRQLLADEPSSILFSAAEHGFTLFDEEQDIMGVALARFDVLTECWCHEIRQRLEAEVN